MSSQDQIETVRQANGSQPQSRQRDEQQPWGSRFLQEVRSRGLGQLLGNSEGLQFDVVDVGGTEVPIVISAGGPGLPSIASPSAHYLDYPLVEWARAGTPTRDMVLRGLALPWRAFVRLTDLDRVVYANHWLLSSSPSLRLDQRELDRLISELIGTHPDHAVVFSRIAPALDPHLGRLLAAMGGRPVQSRVIHLADSRASVSGRSMKRVRGCLNADRSLYQHRLADRVTDRRVLSTHVARMHDLYSSLYLDKHSGLNPRYTEEFFEALIASGEFEATGWFREGSLEVFNLQLIEDDVLRWSVCGYDLSAPRARGLLRLVFASDLFGNDAVRLLNWGAGNEAFKRHRGARPSLEYDVVFDQHLSPRRRASWHLLGALRNFKSSGIARRSARDPHAVRVLEPSGAHRRQTGKDALVPENCEPRLASAQRVVLITSSPKLVFPLLDRDLAALGIEIPLVLLIKPSPLMRDRLRHLPNHLRRQARINRTWPLLQLLYRVVYARATRELDGSQSTGPTLPEALDVIARGRRVMEFPSINQASAVAALRDTDFSLGVVVGADVLTRRTLKSIRLPLVNVHFSDPSFARGMPPVFWEIWAAREKVTLTLHRLELALDAGPIVLQRDVPIQWQANLASTLARTRELAARELATLVEEALPGLIGPGESGNVPAEVERRPVGPLRTIPTLRDLLQARRVNREWVKKRNGA